MIRIDGSRLRQDREDSNYTQDALLELIKTRTGFSISKSTLRRAEKGEVTRKMLNLIAKAIGFSPERYIVETSKENSTKALFDLNGEWKVYYLEDDVGTDEYLVTETLYVNHYEDIINGVYEPYRTNHPEGYKGTDAIIMEGSVMGITMMGQYYVDKKPYPKGAGVFQAIIQRDGEWAEGFCTFYGDDNKIMFSPSLWVKKDSPQFSVMCKQAENYFKGKKLLYSAPFTN